MIDCFLFLFLCDITFFLKTFIFEKLLLVKMLVHMWVGTFQMNSLGIFYLIYWFMLIFICIFSFHYMVIRRLLLFKNMFYLNCFRNTWNKMKRAVRRTRRRPLNTKRLERGWIVSFRSWTCWLTSTTYPSRYAIIPFSVCLCFPWLICDFVS